MVSFPPVSPPRPYTPPSPHPYAPYAQPNSFFSILSPAQYWLRSKNYLVPPYVIYYYIIIYYIYYYIIYIIIFKYFIILIVSAYFNIVHKLDNKIFTHNNRRNKAFRWGNLATETYVLNLQSQRKEQLCGLVRLQYAPFNVSHLPFTDWFAPQVRHKGDQQCALTKSVFHTN